MLNTLHDGPFTQMKEQGDIHVHHYQKGENPDDKKKKEKESKANGNGNGNGAPANGNGNGAPVEAEAAPPPPEDKGNPLAKFSKDEVKRIRDILKKDKEEKEPEKKLSNKKDKVNTKPKMKDTEVKEMSADLAYRAMDKADKKSRGEMSVMDPKRARKKAKQARKFADYSIKKTLNKEEFDTDPKMDEMTADLAYRAMDKADKKSRGNLSWMNPKRARKKAKQAQKFADYSIKKTLNKEEFDTVHEYALEENARIDLKNFAQELKAYSAKIGGIDRNYFDNIANIASMGKMPGKEDIDNDTDPRDKVLDLMTKYIPLNVLKNMYKGLSPSFDHYLQSTTGVKDKSNIKTHVSQNLKRSVTVPEEVEIVEMRMSKKDFDEAVHELQSYIENDMDLYKRGMVPIIKNIQRKMKSGRYDHAKAPKLWMYLVDDGAKKYVKKFGGDVKTKFPKDVRHSVAVNMADEYREAIEDEGGEWYAEEVELDEVESDYAKEIEAFKARGGKIKKLPPGKKFKSKFSKVKGPKKLPIQAEDAENEEFEEAYTMHKGMKIKNVPRSAGKDAVEYNKKRREAQRKRAGLDETKQPVAGWIAMFQGKKLEIKKSEADGIWPAKQLAIKHFKVPKSKQGLLAIKPAYEEVEIGEAKKPNLTSGMECQECGKKFRAKLSTLQYGKTKCPKCKSTDLDFAFGAKNESSVNGIVEGYQKAVLLSLDDAGIDGHFDRDKVVVAKRDVERAKEVLDNDPDIRRTPKIVGEEVETVYEARKSDYQLYHKDFSSAMQHAYAVAKKRGYTVDPQEIDNKVATGPRKPSSGKTNRYILGTDKKQNLHVQVANLDNKRYELNMYIEEVIPEETKMIPTNEKKLDPVGQEDGDVDNDGDKDSSDDYLMKRRNAVKKAMGKRKTGMKEEHQLNTMTDGAFTTADMLAQTYLSMSRDEQIQVTEVTNEDLKEEVELDEVESAYAKQIADYKARGGTVKKYTGPNMKNVKRATSGFKKKLAKTNKIVAQELEREKADQDKNKEIDESDKQYRRYEGQNQHGKAAVYAWKKYHDKKNPKEVAHGKDLKAINKRHDERGHLSPNDMKSRYNISKTYTDRMHAKHTQKEETDEKCSKNVGKLNKVLENRKLERNKVVVDGQGGAGEVGTDELTKKYQEVTPGQPKELIRESSVVINSQDMFKRFEDMVSYMMGISVTHPESFQMFPIGESGKMRLEYEHGPLATICETDVINFFGPNVDMEQFVEMVKEFGVNVTTADNSFVVGDTPGTEGIVKEITPGQYAEEYAKKYTTGGMMDQMRANIEELAKRI